MRNEEDVDNEWHVYLVRCCDNSLYCGITKNLVKRIQYHNDGIGSIYCRSKSPVMLECYTIKTDISTALKLEYRVKQLSTQEKKIRAIKSFVNKN